MSGHAFHRAIYLTGATASGKTAVGVALASQLGAEIIAMDSMTLYRGMDIGTAKPMVAERAGIPHHLIDIIDPWEPSSVALYRQWASDALANVEGRGRQAIFVGGTPLYLKALVRGLFPGPAADLELRHRLEDEAKSHGDPALHARLASIDRVTADRLHPNDRRRIVRALEVFALTGKPLSALQIEHDQPAPANVRVYALELSRPCLHNRINRRVARFFDDGLVDEVRLLLAADRPPCTVAAEGIGYREIIAMLKGEAALDDTIKRVQARTRQFAKRQSTWFRGLSEVRNVPIDDDDDAGLIAKRLAGLIAD